MMRKTRNLGVNAALNVIRTCTSILLAVVTYRYVMRILGTEGMGKVAFGSSIVGYFALLAMLGVSTYAVREGVRCREEPEAFHRFAGEIFTLNLCFTAAAYLLLFAALLILAKLRAYRQLILVQSLSILFATLGVDWIFTIFEDFLFITLRSIAVKLFALGLMFLLVRSEEDYLLYAGISVISDAAVCLSNLLYCRRYCRLSLTAHPRFKAHIRPLLVLFANALTILVYVTFDTTMLGWMKNDRVVGLYDLSVKVYTVLKQVMVAVYAVAIARLSFHAGQQDDAAYRHVFTGLWSGLSLLLIPVSAGVVCLAREIVLFLGGETFLEAVPSLRILALALIFAIFGGLVTACLNVTLRRERENLIATLLGAALNVGLNFLFIPWLAQNGAAITTLLAELFVFLFCWLRIPDKRRYLEQRQALCALRNALLGSLGIVAVSLAAHALLSRPMAVAAVTVLGSVAVYAASLWLLRDPFFLDAVGMLRKKLHR